MKKGNIKEDVADLVTGDIEFLDIRNVGKELRNVRNLIFGKIQIFYKFTHFLVM